MDGEIFALAVLQKMDGEIFEPWMEESSNYECRPEVRNLGQRFEILAGHLEK